jgi:hypothetical protein
LTQTQQRPTPPATVTPITPQPRPSVTVTPSATKTHKPGAYYEDSEFAPATTFTPTPTKKKG